MTSLQSLHRTLLLFLLQFISTLPLIHSHGLLTDPRQRGALVVQNRLVESINSSAPFDPFAHFPSGDKSIAKGSGKRSVIRNAGNNWTPYEPLSPSFRFRAGVCGDELGREQEHLKGGRYYYPDDDPVRVRTYTQGEVVALESNIVTHHNGFMEFFICNIDECGRDISEECFRQGHCQQLLRAPSYCDEGKSEDCGPIDPVYPGRWYLPCGPFPKGQILYGGEKGSMLYQLPEKLVCDHCVIQWYWTSANTCNPPGVVQYFDGEHGPNWSDCTGQGGAIGGVTRVQKLCEGDRFSEEYWQCADVRIQPREGGDSNGDKSNDSEDTNDNGENPQQNDEQDPSGGVLPSGVDGLLNSANAPDPGGILPGSITTPTPMEPQTEPQHQPQFGGMPRPPSDAGKNGAPLIGDTVPGAGEFGEGFRPPLGLRRGTEGRAESTPEGEVAESETETQNDRDGNGGRGRINERNRETESESGRDNENGTNNAAQTETGNGLMGGVVENGIGEGLPQKRRGPVGGVGGIAGGVIGR